MNRFEKRLKQGEFKITHYSYVVEVKPIHPYLQKKYGVFEPFEKAGALERAELKVNGQRLKRKPEFKKVDIEDLQERWRTGNWSCVYRVYYYDPAESEEQRRQDALAFGLKEFKRDLNLGERFYQEGEDYELVVHKGVEYEHYQRLQEISLLEYLKE